VARLHRWAIEFSTTLVCVLHENPGTETGKTRGHLGSQLERKAECNLRLQKDREGITVVFTERSRGAHIPKAKGPRFQWNDEAKMHISCGTAAEAKASARDQQQREFAIEVFRDCPASVGLSWEEVHGRIESLEGIKRSGARKRFDRLVAAKAIRKAGERYRLS
jgi:hypothetical protein